MGGALGVSSGVSVRALVFFFVKGFLGTPCVVEGEGSFIGLGEGGWAVDAEGGSCPRNSP